ncbi:DcrB-related protein [Pseudomonas sp. KNUC1026]|uniref:DcrB-related protein n=1 Tax=Pseudomonas sp. KNUC1026 TaxID=2893890 RepID=UPI001F42FDA7|nr:DcrB-related protein [Pseudomonas sp. KNUC1026]UFH49087.1 DUF1795 domain-containing protein [Pseudomonas sp. KNUC1026]
MTLYRLNELALDLPGEDYQDSSLNVLRFAALGTSLIISRSPLPADSTLQATFLEQLNKLKSQVQGFQATEPQAVSIDGVAALEVRSQFSQGGNRVWQYQAALVVPQRTQLLALSYVKNQPMGDAEAAHWAQLKQSAQFL